MGSEKCQKLPGVLQGEGAFEEEKPACGRTRRENQSVFDDERGFCVVVTLTGKGTKRATALIWESLASSGQDLVNFCEGAASIPKCIPLGMGTE